MAWNKTLSALGSNTYEESSGIFVQSPNLCLLKIEKHKSAIGKIKRTHDIQ